MSDNDFSDVDLDVESNGSPADTGLHLDDSKKHARAQHNALERRRRDNIKDMYSSLKEEIPNFNNSERASRAHVLKRTIEQIKDQKLEIQELSEDKKRINAENEKLLAEIAQREAALHGTDSNDTVMTCMASAVPKTH